MSAQGAAAMVPKKLLIVRLGAMGDVIHTLHAAALLRQSFPESQIGWVIEERWAELLCAKGETRSGPRNSARPLVDFVHAVDTKTWRKSPLSSPTRQQFSAAIQELRNENYDLALDFQGAIKSAILAKLSRPEALWGMQNPREAPARMFYAHRVQTRGAHVIEQYESLARAVLEFAGIFGKDVAPEIQFPDDDRASAAVAAMLQNAHGPVVLLNPGAGWGAKQWPVERYGEVAAGLAKDGCTVHVNYGPGEEQLAHAVESASQGSAKGVCCSIAELIALTRRLNLFIGGDTGPLHLAAALGVPAVAIFGPTDPARNGPYRTRKIVIRNPASKSSLSHTGEPDPGLLQITGSEVLLAARQLLEHSHA